MFGSALLITTLTGDPGMVNHLETITRWKILTRKAKVDVELQNHPPMDDFVARLNKQKQRKAGQPHPFIVSQDGYAKFVDVMDECMKAV